MAKNNSKKKQETGGLQAPKMSVVEREEHEIQKEQVKKVKEREKARKEKKEKKQRRSILRVFREVGGELKKVRWPSFAQAVAQTGVVLGVVLVFSLVVFGIDRGLSELYQLLVDGL